MKYHLILLLCSLFFSSPSWSIGYLAGTLQPGPYSLSTDGVTTQHFVTTLGAEVGFYLPSFSRSITSIALAYELGEGLNRGNDLSFQESLRTQNLALRIQMQFNKWLLGVGMNQRQMTVTSVSLPTGSSQTIYQGITPELILAYKLGTEFLSPWIYFNYSTGSLTNHLNIQSLQFGARLAIDSK